MDSAVKQLEHLLELCGIKLSAFSETNAAIAGSAVTQAVLNESWKESDIDIWIPTAKKHKVKEMLRMLAPFDSDNYNLIRQLTIQKDRIKNNYARLSKYVQDVFVMNSISGPWDYYYRLPSIQFMFLNPGISIEDVVKSFDLSCTQFMYTPSTGIRAIGNVNNSLNSVTKLRKFYITQEAFKEQSPREWIRTLYRVEKYVKRGFKFSEDADIIDRIIIAAKSHKQWSELTNNEKKNISSKITYLVKSIYKISEEINNAHYDSYINQIFWRWRIQSTFLHYYRKLNPVSKLPSQCYDFVEMQYTDVSNQSESVILLHDGQEPTNTTCHVIERDKTDNIFYECEGRQPKIPTNDWYENAYAVRKIPLSSGALVYVDYSLYNSMLHYKQHKVFKVITTDFEFKTTSSYGAAYLTEDNAFVSAHHCQDGTEKKVSLLIPLFFQDSSTGGSINKKQKKKKKEKR